MNQVDLVMPGTMYGAGTASRERADAKEMSPAFLPKKKKENFVKNKQIYHKFI